MATPAGAQAGLDDGRREVPKLGLFGGSFDPIHHGHLRPVRRAIAALDLDRVVYLPTGRPPHKSRRLTPAASRFAMVELALLGETKMFASPFELAEDQPSFTVDTLEHFRKALPGTRLFLVLGSDSFVQLPRWRSWRRILTLAELAVLARPGWDPLATEVELADELAGAIEGGRAHLVANPPTELSSTEVRRAMAAGEEPTGAVPPLVLDYIRKYGLYRTELSADLS